MPLTRISITIPDDLVEWADERADALDRSRSWLIVEALRRYLREVGVRGERAMARVAESAPPVYLATSEQTTPAQSVAPLAEVVDIAPEIAAAQKRRLRAELQLSPEERLKRAEELGRLGLQAQGRKPRLQVIGFSSYEDYYEWKRHRLIGG